MKILLTGSAGFIGFHVTKALLDRGDEVFGIDSLNEYYDIRLKLGRLRELGINEGDFDLNQIYKSSDYENFLFQKIDLTDKEGLKNLFTESKFDAVCNLAAQAGVRYSLENPQSYIDSNITGFMNILECCRDSEVLNLSYASSSSVYGLNQSYPFSVNDHTDHPISIYAATKKSNELMAHTYSHLFNLNTTGLRFFTVYGPWGRPDMALFKFTKAALEGDSIKVYNKGNMYRDFTFVDDICAVVLASIDNPAMPDNKWSAETMNPSSSTAPFRIYNIGNNNPVNLLDFIATLEKTLGIEIVKEFLPIQPGDVQKTYANVDNTFQDFNYKPSTPIEYGVEKFVEWYLNFYKVKG